MPATRNRVTVVARVSGQKDKCVRVERRSLGSERNMQRQCSTGELEFDTDTQRFVHVKKADRKPLTVPKETMGMDFFPIVR